MIKPRPFRSVKDVPREELMTGGTFACSACQSVYGERLVFKALGRGTIMVNPAGCMTLTATYPFTPYRENWIFNAIENAASTAAGITMGLKARGKKANVVCYAGDGATYDIGFQALSGAIQRKDDFIYVCYNNSGYQNTGYQQSSATPLYARTNTTPVGSRAPRGNVQQRKPMTKVIAAHGAPYVATACPSYPLDFMNKLRKASTIRGLKFIDLLCPCMPGWLVKEKDAHRVGKLMVDSGIWPLYEIENGKFTLNRTQKTAPVSKAMELQGRFAHLNNKAISEIQAIVDREWAMLAKGQFWDTEFY